MAGTASFLVARKPPVAASRRRLALSLAGALTLMFSGVAAGAGVTGRPVIRHYDGSEAGLGTVPFNGPVWAMVRTPGGALVAGGEGLAVFDGYKWRKVDVPGAGAIRALAAGGEETPERIYVGAKDEIGLVERRADGTWTYISLADGFDPVDRRPVGDVWSVHPVTNGAVWVTSEAVIRWVSGAGNRKLEVFRLPAKPRLQGFSDRDGALVYQRGTGLLRVGATGEPVVVMAESSLPESGVTWMVRAEAGSYLIGLGDQAYRWDPLALGSTGAFTRLDELSAALKDSLPTSATSLGGNRLAVGTYKRGVIVADRDGRVWGRIDGAAGLADDNVNEVKAGGSTLWAALGTGLARIDGAGTVTRFDRAGGLVAETTRRVFEGLGQTNVLTSKGLYRVAEGSGGLEPVLTGEALLWDAMAGEGSVLVGGLGGVWRVEGKEVEHIHHVSADVFRIAAVPGKSGMALMVENYRLRVLYPSPLGGWASADLSPELNDTPVSWWVGAEAGDAAASVAGVWVATANGGIYRFEWTEDSGRGEPESVPRPGLRARAYFQPGRGLPDKAGRSELVALGGRLYAFSQAGILRYENAARGFVAVPELQGYVGVAATGDGDPAYWVVQARSLADQGAQAVMRVGIREGNLQLTPVEFGGLDAAGAVNRIDRTGDGRLWLGGNRGLVRGDESALSEAGPVPAAVLVLSPEAGDTGARRHAFQFPSLAGSGPESYWYQTRLSGVDADWSAPTREAGREFVGLGAGDYRFEVRLMDRFGRTGGQAAQVFTVLAPWWRRPVAYAGYGVTAVLVVLGLARWRVRRLRTQNERLNRLVEERTRELELSNTAKNEFLENISHELRNPLNGVLGMVGRLRVERMPEEDRGVVKLLRASAHQMARAFEDVLGFSKLEYGYVNVERLPFRLRETLEEVIELQAAAAEQRGCAVTLQWPGRIADGFVGDAGKIKMVVSNFVSNALKYAPGKPVTMGVDVLAAPGSESGGAGEGMVTLLIEVSDQGPGIPADEQELIFRKFVRGSGAKKNQVAGTGLGLATCSVLARLMNGNVGVESRVGQGSVFYLRLLLPRADPAGLPVRPAGGSVLGAGTKALVVEDEDYNQAVLEGIALELGLDPEIVADAVEARAKLAGRDYPVVFLDWELPGAKGGEIARAMRAQPDGHRAIILATTAHDSDEIRAECRAAGMDGFLLKPFNADIVRRVLAEVEAKRNTVGAEFIVAAAAKTEANGVLEHDAFKHYARARPQEAAQAPARYRRSIQAELEKLLGADNDYVVAAVCAHRLRALGGLVGAVALNRAAGRLEELLKSGTKPERTAQVDVVRRECEALIAGMERPPTP